MRVHFSIEGKLLKNVAGRFRAKSDPYAIVEINGSYFGKTETIKNDLNPFWTKVFILDEHTVRPGLTIHVTIFDDNEIRKKKDVEMGRAQFELSSVLCRGGKMERKNTGVGDGQIILHANEVVLGQSIGTMELQFRALDVMNIDFGLLRLSSTDPFYEISKKFSDPSVGISKWLPVVRSLHQRNFLNPVWDPFKIDLEELCNCDLDADIKITIFDWEKDMNHREVGSIQTTVSNLMAKRSRRGNADKKNAIIIRESDDDQSGTAPVAHLIVLKCDFCG